MSLLNAVTNISRDVYHILRNSRAPDKSRLLRCYISMTAIDLGIRRGLMRSPPVQDICGARARFLGYGMLLDLWREIYIGEPYYFESQSPQPVILDVGSNIGMALFFFKRLYPESKIVAFEPDPRVFEILQANVELNGFAGVTLVNKAAHKHTGTLEWHYDSTHPELPSMSAVPRDMLPDSMQVPCVRLSEFVNGPIDFLKLDVEGAEGTVMLDLCVSGKLSWIKKIVIEYHPWSKGEDNRLSNILRILEESGFDVGVSGGGSNAAGDGNSPLMLLARRAE